MDHTIRTEGVVGADHRLILTLPAEVPPGRVQVTVTLSPGEPERKMTPKELAESEFFGDWKDRDDLPTTNEEFIEWRRKLWEQPKA